MKLLELAQLALLFGALIGIAPVFGGFLARLFEGQTPLAVRWLRPLERILYRIGGVNPGEEMSWKRYLSAVLVFNAAGILILWGLQLIQARLPLNPQQFENVPWLLALNTAVSFATNTNWQAYAGETTLSYLTQMAGLAVQNFLSAATGIGVMLAITRGLRRASTGTLGNFWADLTRATVYVLLPLSFLLAVVLVSQGVVQSFAPYTKTTTLEGAAQVVPLGPAASQIAIKHLGTNGGGFFGQNSAHPFENPTPLTNFLELFGMLLIPASLVFTFGAMTGDRRHAACLFGTMLVLLLGGFALAWWAELQPNPAFGGGGPLLEGKETRFGVMNSVLFATATTGTSCGAVNAMHDSFSPLAGLVPLLNMMLGCVYFGGVGAGIYGILMYVLIVVFIAGLMVGRTPEYQGKKIQAWEASWAIAAILVPGITILIGSALACSLPAGLATLGNPGAHGLSEILYAFSSAAANDGSAFAGLGANTAFYNLALAAAMLIGRFAAITAALAIAGSLAAKKPAPPSPGTFPTDGLTFAVTLLIVILIVGALTFFPALCLGPIVEQGLLLQGRLF
ncbi:MAG: potassium-transporting ATPase subunit KdpA [Kiritimatiellia bacterium]